MKKLKEQLEEVSPELLEKVKKLTSDYGFEFEELKVTSKQNPVVRSNPTEAECKKDGKIRRCNLRKDGTTYCRCVNPV